MKAALAQLRHLYQQLLDGHVKDTKEASLGLLGPSIEELEKYENRNAELEKELEEEDREHELSLKALDKEMTKNEQLQSIINALPHCMGEWIPNEDGMRYVNKKCDRLATHASSVDEYAHCDLHGFKTITLKEVGWASAVRILEPCPVVEAVVEEAPKKIHLPVIK